MNERILSRRSHGKLLVICGPTSTGKTALAINIAKKFNGEIVSADSRQVYKNLDIGTGKDIPKNSKIKYPLFSKYGYYLIDGVKVWGYDLASPKDEFSISHYLKFASKIINDIQKKGKLPILTGGTGLYIKSVIYGIPTIDVPKNEKLREELDKRSANELYEKLSQMDSFKAASLNSSDKQNPRRLIRAIEVAQWNLSHGKNISETQNLVKKNSVLEIGLKAPFEAINDKIKHRVMQRIKDGIKEEIKKLINSGIGWENQAMASIGYRQWRDYFEGAVEEEKIIEEWEKEERNYAKRQITWFKKDKNINWFDITNSNHVKSVEKLVEKWDNNDEDATQN